MPFLRPLEVRATSPDSVTWPGLGILVPRNFSGRNSGLEMQDPSSRTQPGARPLRIMGYLQILKHHRGDMFILATSGHVPASGWVVVWSGQMAFNAQGPQGWYFPAELQRLWFTRMGVLVGGAEGVSPCPKSWSQDFAPCPRIWPALLRVQQAQATAASNLPADHVQVPAAATAARTR